MDSLYEAFLGVFPYVPAERARAYVDAAPSIEEAISNYLASTEAQAPKARMPDVLEALERASEAVSRPKDPSYSEGVYKNVSNGDCLFAALAMGIKAYENKPITSFVKIAQDMRTLLFDFYDANWNKECIMNRMKWHELVFMTHNAGITEDERRDYGTWDSNPQTRHLQWLSERDSVYGGQVEILAFVSIYKYIKVRIFRRHQKQMRLCDEFAVPGVQNYIYFDLLHTGKMDTSNAHWQLLKTSSVPRDFPMTEQKKRKRSK